jgi:hypothetical protein
VYAFGAGGTVRAALRPRLAAGQDVGVESLGFVPVGFRSGGAAFMADLGAPGAPTEGTDSVLLLRGRALTSRGVRGGDLLLATEAAGMTVRVRCARRCTVLRVASAFPATHAEGHIAFAPR